MLKVDSATVGCPVHDLSRMLLLKRGIVRRSFIVCGGTGGAELPGSGQKGVGMHFLN